MQRQLFRSRANRVFAGVCGGIGEYFGIDPTIVRILWVLVSLSTLGTGLVVYIVAAIIIPETDTGSFGGDEYGHHNNGGYGQNYDPKKASLVIGGVLVLLGILILARRFLIWIDSGIMWSIILIIVGLFVIFKGRK